MLAPTHWRAYAVRADDGREDELVVLGPERHERELADEFVL